MLRDDGAALLPQHVGQRSRGEILRPHQGHLETALPLLVGRVESHENLFAGAHLGDLMAERAQRREDRLALRIADLGLRAHEDARDESHDSAFPTMRLYASRYRSLVPFTTSGGRAGAGGSLFQPLCTRKSRTYCLSNEAGELPGLYTSASQ